MMKPEELRKKFNHEIQTKIITIFVYGYLGLALVGYFFTTFTVKSHLNALTQSQNYSISVQEWRNVINGVNSGWTLYPKLKGICLISNDRHILDSWGECPSSSPLLSIGMGLTSIVEFPQFQVRVELTKTLWLWGLIFPFIVFSVIGIFILFFRKSFILKSQLEIIDLIQNVDSTQKELTSFQQIIHTQTDEIVNLKKQALIAKVASQVSHDIRSPLTALDIVLSDLSVLPEEKRTLARMAVSRIKDIANNLLTQNRNLSIKSIEEGISLAPQEGPESMKPQMIVSLIENILSEKRLQLNTYNTIQLSTEFSDDSVWAFVNHQGATLGWSESVKI